MADLRSPKLRAHKKAQHVPSGSLGLGCHIGSVNLLPKLLIQFTFEYLNLFKFGLFYKIDRIRFFLIQIEIQATIIR